MGGPLTGAPKHLHDHFMYELRRPGVHPHLLVPRLGSEPEARAAPEDGGSQGAQGDHHHNHHHHNHHQHHHHLIIIIMITITVISLTLSLSIHLYVVYLYLSLYFSLSICIYIHVYIYIYIYTYVYIKLSQPIPGVQENGGHQGARGAHVKYS